MSHRLTEKYPHLQFRQHWTFTKEVLYLLGQCEAYVEAINNTPILPENYADLLHVALRKGVQATTAIEGNTLTEEEIDRIMDGKHLEPSKEYQEIEVRNIINAFNILHENIVLAQSDDHEGYIITPDRIRQFHNIVGSELGKQFDAIPGRFRTDSRVVGTYRCPDHEDVAELVELYCQWLLEHFHYDKGQDFSVIVVEAIIAHVYLEWIHPFGDGNGRTGRLLEFYILLRGGYPDIASHILSNHYNLTRTEYYRQLELCRHKRDLTDFLEYALVGFRDGLRKTLEAIQRSQFDITWRHHIYDTFGDVVITQQDVFKRRRRLILEMPYDREYTLDDIPLVSPPVAKMYGSLSERTLRRDVERLVEIGLLIHNAQSRTYRPDISAVQKLMARRRQVAEQ